MSKSSRFARARKQANQHPRYPDYPVVNTQTADELFRRLVDDGINRRPTPVSWLMEAVPRIAELKRTKADTVFQELQDIVRERTGFGLTVEPGRL